MIQQLQKGDQKVMGEIYRLYRSDFIDWMKARYNCSNETARDIYQNTMLTISLKAQNGTLNIVDSSLKTYIYGVAKNKYKEYQRTNGRYLSMEEGSFDHLQTEEPASSNEAEVALVHKCLIELGDPCKTVLELYYFHGMTMEEISSHLTYKNSQTAKNMKYKCFRRLKEIFQREKSRITLKQ